MTLIIHAKLQALKEHKKEVAAREALAVRNLVVERAIMRTFYKRTAKVKKEIDAFFKTAEKSGLIVQKPFETLCECDFLPENDVLCCLITSKLIDEEHLEYEKKYASYGYCWRLIEPTTNKDLHIELYLTLDSQGRPKVSITADEVAKKIFDWLVKIYKEVLDQPDGKHEHHIHKDE